MKSLSDIRELLESMPETFEHESEENIIQFDDHYFNINITYQGEIEWEYDSGDASVGINAGVIGRIINTSVSSIKVYNYDTDTLAPATPEEMELLKNKIPSLSQDEKRHILKKFN